MKIRLLTLRRRELEMALGMKEATPDQIARFTDELASIEGELAELQGGDA